MGEQLSSDEDEETVKRSWGNVERFVGVEGAARPSARQSTRTLARKMRNIW
jgi:hypothetical protein